jgi:hypothetical protein
MTDLWLESQQKLSERYEPWDIYNADEMGLFCNCTPEQY